MNKLAFAALAVSITAVAAEPKKRLECTRLEAAAPSFALEFEVHPKLPPYELKVDAEAGEDFRRVEQLTVGPKGVADKAQTIGADQELDAMLLNDTYPVLQCDVNFDGYQDLLVFAMTGTPANEWFQFLIFDPVKGRFVLSPKELVGNPQLDAAKKQVVGEVGSGCCSTTTTRFKVEKTRVKKVAEKNVPMKP